MRALGLDLGSKTLGVAINEEGMDFVHPLTTLRAKHNDLETLLKGLKEIIDQYQITHLALGYPLNMNGTPSVMSNHVLNFKERLHKIYPNLVIELIDERLSSVQANKSLNSIGVYKQASKDQVDQVAATIILETLMRRYQHG